MKKDTIFRSLTTLILALVLTTNSLVQVAFSRPPKASKKPSNEIPEKTAYSKQQTVDAATQNLLKRLKGSDRRVAKVIVGIVRRTNGQTEKIIGVGSHMLGNGTFKDPLVNNGTSDFDYRFVYKGDKASAIRRYKQVQKELREAILREFGSDGKLILSKINLYPPEQVIGNIDDSAQAIKDLNNAGINPNLGKIQVDDTGKIIAQSIDVKTYDGLAGKGGKAFRDTYEALKGRVFWNNKGTVSSGFADILPFNEVRGIYTIEGSANTANQLKNFVEQNIREGDYRAALKNLKRTQEVMKKGRDLSRLSKKNYVDDLLDDINKCCTREVDKVLSNGRKIKATEIVEEALEEQFKNPQFRSRLRSAFKHVELDSAMLKEFALRGNPRELSILRELLEQGASASSGKWAKTRQALLELGDEFRQLGSYVPWGKVFKGLMAVLIAYQVYDVSKKASNEDWEGAYREAAFGSATEVAVMVGGIKLMLPVLIIQILVASFIDEVKASSYNRVASYQDCQNLIAGIYEVKGREAILINQRYETSIEQLATKYNDYKDVLKEVGKHARMASRRGDKFEPEIEKSLNERCGKEVITKWQSKRLEIIGDAIVHLKKFEETLASSLLVGESNPEEVWLLPEKPAKVDVRATLRGDLASIQQHLREFEKTIKSVGGYVSVKHYYKWIPLNLEDENLTSADRPVFDRERASRTFNFNEDGNKNLRLEYRIEVKVQTTADDIFDVARSGYLNTSLVKTVPFNINVLSPKGIAEIIGPQTAKANSNVNLTAKTDSNLQKLNPRFVWYDLTANSNPKGGKNYSFTPTEDERSKRVLLEVFANINGEDMKVAQAEKIISVGTKDDKKEDEEPTKPDTETVTTSGAIKITAPKEVLAGEIFDLKALIPKEMQERKGIMAVGDYEWDADSACQVDEKESLARFISPYQDKEYKEKIKLFIWSKMQSDLQKKGGAKPLIEPDAVVILNIVPSYLKGTLPNIWEGDTSWKYLNEKSISRKRATRKLPLWVTNIISVTDAEEIGTTFVTGDISLRMGTASQKPNIQQEIDEIKNREPKLFKNGKISSIKFGGFEGLIIESGAVEEKGSSGQLSVTSKGSGYAVKGCLGVYFSYKIKGEGYVIDRVVRDSSGAEKRLKWNDRPFLVPHVTSGEKEAQNFLKSLKFAPARGIDLTAYNGPSLDGSDLASVKLVLSPNKKQLKKGDIVEVQAVVENTQTEDEPFDFKWTGNHAGKGNKVQFVADKGGKHTLTVEVDGKNYPIGTDSVTFEVADLKAEIRQLTSMAKVPVGVPVVFSAELLSEGKPADGNYIYRFQPSPEVKFETNESANKNTKAVFSKPGKKKVWVQILEQKGDSLETVAESEQIEIEVVEPELKITFDQEKAMVGKAVKAKVDVVPADLKEIDFRWEVSSNAKQTLESNDSKEITFIPQDNKPITVKVSARVPVSGDGLGEQTAMITAQQFDVKVDVLGTIGPKPKIWKEGVGLVPVDKGIAVFQNVGLKATVTPTAENLRYRWTLNEDSHFTGGSSSAEVRVNRSQTGMCQATVVVTDKDGIELGRGTGSFNVSISQDDLNTAKKASESAEKVKEAKALNRKGQIDEAINKANEASQLNPQNTEAKALAQKLKIDKQTIQTQMTKTRGLMSQSMYPEAQVEFIKAKNLNPYYKPVQELEVELRNAWTKYDGDIRLGLGDVRVANERKDFKKALELAKQMRAKYKLRAGADRDLRNYENWAKTHEAEKERQRAILKRGEEKFRNKDYAGAIKDFNVMYSNFNNYWNVNIDPEPKKYGDLKAQAVRYNNQINQLMPTVRRVANYKAASAKMLQEAMDKVEQVLAISPNHSEANKYRTIIKARLGKAVTSEISQTIKRGEGYHSRKNYRNAIGEFDKVIKLDPENSEAYRLRGLSKQALKDTNGALRDFNRAIEINPRSYKAFADRGALYGATKNMNRAMNDLNQSIRLNPRYTKAYSYRGMIKLLNKDYRGAVSDISIYIRSNPRDASAHFNRGLAKHYQRNYQGALQDYSRAIVLNPDYGAAYRNRGTIKEGLNDLLGAKADLERALQINPRDSSARKSLNRVLAKLNRNTSKPPKPTNTPRTTQPPTRREVEIAKVNNVYGVQNRPTAPTRITFRKPYKVTFIQTYHWNNGRGTSRAGTIGLRHSSGKMYGPWRASGVSGRGRARNIYWQVRPNVALPPGTYTVVDSDPSTWAQNRQSRGKGFVIIKGYEVSGTSTPPTTSPPSTSRERMRISITYVNASRQTVHLFASGEKPTNINRLRSGSKRTASGEGPKFSSVTIYAYSTKGKRLRTYKLNVKPNGKYQVTYNRNNTLSVKEIGKSGSSSTSNNVRMYLTFINYSKQDVHIFPESDGFSPGNRLKPRTAAGVYGKGPRNGKIKIVAGRNGRVISYVWIPVIPEAQYTITFGSNNKLTYKRGN